MGNARAADLHTKVLHMAEFGNGVIQDYGPLALTGVNAAEKAYLGVIPAGTRVTGVHLKTSGTFGATTTVHLGYEPVSGSDPAASASYWFTSADSTSALNAHSAAAAITFDKPVFLVATVNVANVTGSPTISAVVTGKAVGVK